MTYNSPLTDIKGVGAEVAKKLMILGLHTVSDLIAYYPRRYDDYSHVQTIHRLKPGVVTIKAVIKQAKGRYARRGLHITEAIGSDESGSVRLVWFNQPYRAVSIKPNTEYYISGEFALKNQHLCIMNPSMELVSDFPVNTARIIPIYKETKGIKSAQLRRFIRETMPAIRNIPETIPEWLVEAYKLIPLAKAIEMMHFPGDPGELLLAKRRLGFEEIFCLSLAALINKGELATEHALSIPFDEQLARRFVSHLPFVLTNDQRKAVWQTYLDMQKVTPMNRLIEGDVGSGKTVVAAMAAVMAMQQGYQVALMAPTELLARQHTETIYELLQPLGMSGMVGLLIGGLKPLQKRAVHRAIKDGRVRFIIGTHALIQDTVDMHKLGLVIIDEQHRFGVEQRKALQSKAGHAVHVLNTTATPIPRSLALTLYGELDISIIAAKPTGRKQISTQIVSPNSRTQLYKSLLNELQMKRQIFVVCPLITESDSLPVKSAEMAYQEMQQAFKEYTVGILHGKMKPEEKDAVMQQFVRQEIDILVSTTVIEVGVNVPNATVMLIENAERFGLAQIHQLRGRVGRGEYQGYCYLMMSDSSAPSRRLRALEGTDDGFALAELDLEIRGPGAIYGTMQHGQLDLRVANLTDTSLIIAAREAAQTFVNNGENLVQYPTLAHRVEHLRAVTNLN